jgi:hypothetical protein
MKNNILWDVTLCSFVEIYRRFGEISWCHLQGGNNKQSNSQPDVGSKLIDFLLPAFWFFVWFARRT